MVTATLVRLVSVADSPGCGVGGWVSRWLWQPFTGVDWEGRKCTE